MADVKSVKLSAFVPSHAPGVCVPAASAPPVGYQDGAEQAILRVVRDAADRSVGSGELGAHADDWGTLYHLSPYRSTILDCLGFGAAGDASVLELGAGCGAVTRWLGEHFGHVDAVEGSLERAEVAAARSVDLDGVSVFSTNYSTLDERDAYDMATLIGVLEYSHLYHPDTQEPRAAAVENLRVAHRALRDQGVLVVAIENRLGLKYLSGAREDHSERPFDSINGYPSHDHAVTWSARELEAMLGDAGFGDVDVLVPFPDYKLATTIVDPARVRDEHHVHNWLQGTAPDWGRPRRAPAFSETLAARELVTAGLLKDLANSFLVLAYKGDRDAVRTRLGIEHDWAARRYALEGRPVVRKRMTLPADSAHVVVEPVFGAAAEREGAEIDLGPFSHALRGALAVGDDLATIGVLRTLKATDNPTAPFLAHVREHAAWLECTHGTARTDSDNIMLVDGAALDATWLNLTASGQPVSAEWRFRGVLPLDYLVWRNVKQFLEHFIEDLPAAWRRDDAATLAWSLITTAGVASAHRLDLARHIESAFDSAAGFGPLVEPNATLQSLADDAHRLLVLASAEEIIATPELLKNYAAAIEPTDPLTLVLDPTGADPDLIPRLQSAIAAAGLDEATMPDTLVAEPATLPTPTALLTATSYGPTDLPRFAGSDLTALRALARTAA
jgi:SAM-dependent methyltransferase